MWQEGLFLFWLHWSFSPYTISYFEDVLALLEDSTLFLFCAVKQSFFVLYIMLDIKKHAADWETQANTETLPVVHKTKTVSYNVIEVRLAEVDHLSVMLEIKLTMFVLALTLR